MIDQAWPSPCLTCHDSIHGSSVDEVHDEMTSRYCQVRQIASGVAHHAMMHLADGLGQDGTHQNRVFYFINRRQPYKVSMLRFGCPDMMAADVYADETGS